MVELKHNDIIIKFKRDVADKVYCLIPVEDFNKTAIKNNVEKVNKIHRYVLCNGYISGIEYGFSECSIPCYRVLFPVLNDEISLYDSNIYNTEQEAIKDYQIKINKEILNELKYLKSKIDIKKIYKDIGEQ